jgi:hypothetical protein
METPPMTDHFNPAEAHFLRLLERQCFAASVAESIVVRLATMLCRIRCGNNCCAVCNSY